MSIKSKSPKTVREFIKEDIEILKSRKFVLDKRQIEARNIPVLARYIKREKMFVDSVAVAIKSREEMLEKLFWKYQNKLITIDQELENVLLTPDYKLELKAKKLLLLEIMKDLK